MDGEVQQVQTTETVGLPQDSYSPPNQGSNKWIIVGIILALVALGGGVFFLLRSNNDTIEASPTPTPFIEEFTPEPTQTSEPIDRSGIDIEVLNGTGIAKEASVLADLLKQMGYESVTTGNVDRSDPTVTEVTFTKTVPSAVVEEITAKLQETYKQVKSTTGTLAKGSVKIVVGLRKGATAKPSASPTAKPSASASPTASGTATSSPTPSPTGTQ